MKLDTSANVGAAGETDGWHQPGTVERRYDLDWLRIMAVLLLVPFHSALIFSLNPRDIVYVKDVVESPALVAAAGFIHQFHMPLLFVIAGAGTWFALRKHSGGAYLAERANRLLIPALFGVTVLIPPMLYLQFLWNPGLKGRYASFWDYYPHFFTFTGDVTGTQGNFTPAHLWFIFYLFIYSAALLPLFLYLRRGGTSIIERVAAFASRPGAIFLFGLIVLLSQAVQVLGDQNPIYLIVFFIVGFVLMSEPRFQRAIDRQMWVALGCAVVAGLSLSLWMWPWSWGFETGSWQHILTGLVSSMTIWCWIIAFLGIGHRYLNKTGKVLSYLNLAAYPFYILHLPIDTLVGFYVIGWDTTIAVKYIAINLATIALTLAVYEVVVRHTNLTRRLFGMKPLSVHITPRQSRQLA